MLRRWGVLLLAGFAYLGFCLSTGMSLPCPFRLLTGYLCPGCGVTHMALALAHGDLYGAMSANPAILLTAPLMLALQIREDSHWIRTGNIPDSDFYLPQILLAAFLLFGVWRNFAG